MIGPQAVSETMRSIDGMFDRYEEREAKKAHERRVFLAELEAWKREQEAAKAPPPPSNRITNEEKAMVINLRLKKQPYNTIAAAVGRSEASCRLIWHRFNAASDELEAAAS